MGRFFNKGDRVYDTREPGQRHGTVTEGTGYSGECVMVKFDDDNSYNDTFKLTENLRACRDDRH